MKPYHERRRNAKQLVRKWKAEMIGKTRGQMTVEENRIWDIAVLAREYCRAAPLIAQWYLNR